MHALERRATLASKKRPLDEWDNERFVDLVDVLTEKTNVATMGQPKKTLSGQNVSSYTENILDLIVRELEKVAKTEGIKNEEPINYLSIVIQLEKLREIMKYQICQSNKAACAMIYNTNWCMNQYQETRLPLKQYKFLLPVRNDIDDYSTRKH